MQNKIISLRPHHGMCLAYFKGKGYSDEFSRHMQEMQYLLLKGADVKLQVKTDEICLACPNNKEGYCISCEQVEKYDQAVLKMCGFSEGDVVSFQKFAQKVEQKILASGKRQEICKDCEWNEICEKSESEDLFYDIISSDHDCDSVVSWIDAWNRSQIFKDK